ncbi:MAG: Kae1-associated serine/threonine protein kinase [Candidatus Aenigmarchaeota archaeon]|nr:Kae1-associated serine/threonine protein kinase [Candidatus Aenigmarchaeota archaeon]
MDILHRGAEAILFLENGNMVKRRLKKGYRIPQLDTRIRKQRTKREASLLTKAKRLGINVPTVFDVQGDDIIMEFIRGKRIKEFLRTARKKERAEACEKIGAAAAALHEAGIMHGDLTTSNMLLSKGELMLIDFGLARTSSRVEDHAVDLILLFEALKAGHYPILKEVWGGVLKAYKRNYSNASSILRQCKSIEKRRRYKN